MISVYKISNTLRDGIKKKGYSSLVVSGGTSLLDIFAKLSKEELEWDKVFVTLVDNRLVPENDSDNNENIVKTEMLINNAQLANFIPLQENSMKDFHEILPFDLVLLGMGKDGHFASIFPDMVRDKRFIGLEEPPRIYKISQRGDPFVPRITMNLSLILNSKLILLCISSVEKKLILEKSKQEIKYPVHWLLNQKKTVVEIEMGNTSHD